MGDEAIDIYFVSYSAVVKVTVKNPKYTPHTVNFIESMQKVTSDK